MKAEVEADFYAAVTRRPTVYRGNPFLVEVGLAYGGDMPADDGITLLPLREPRPAAVPAGCLRHHEGGHVRRTGSRTSSSSPGRDCRSAPCS